MKGNFNRDVVTPIRNMRPEHRNSHEYIQTLVNNSRHYLECIGMANFQIGKVDITLSNLSPLHIAAFEGNHLYIRKFIEHYSRDMNTLLKNINGQTSLTNTHHPLKYLGDATPLHLALYKAQSLPKDKRAPYEKTVQRLLEAKGIDASIRNATQTSINGLMQEIFPSIENQVTRPEQVERVKNNMHLYDEEYIAKLREDGLLPNSEIQPGSVNETRQRTH